MYFMYIFSYVDDSTSGNETKIPTKAINLFSRLGEINQHRAVGSVLSFCVVPHIVAIHSICVFIYQYIATDTYMYTCPQCPPHLTVHTSLE